MRSSEPPPSAWKGTVWAAQSTPSRYTDPSGAVAEAFHVGARTNMKSTSVAWFDATYPAPPALTRNRALPSAG
eukprot:CAMPEP_0173447258 /NCGR_PEP_ID=MMETSP1357-20121228/38298_1 /TAXON_ID=77926 /ORGANISM="Hemiselmis rufescens, Strain PCC563" /LENGTH=72 /DNA_ID=CAMNT_0014413629 /DNA_START=59 /DNA_END=273 /DNA_ORIENTATION=+